jgi:anti-sigma B factor antagonist
MSLDEDSVNIDSDFVDPRPIRVDQTDLLQVQASWVGDTVVMGLNGEVSLMTVPLLHQYLRQLSGYLGGGLIIDLGLVTFLDSAGLAFLVSTQMRLKAEGSRLVVYAPTPHIRNLFDICDLTPRLVIVPDTFEGALS